MTAEPTLQSLIETATAPLAEACVTAGPRAMQRGFADAIEGHVCDHVRGALAGQAGLTTHAARSRRSLEDFSLTRDGATAWVDVKSRDTGGTFSMPNLVSIERLWKLLEAPRESLMFIFTDYTVTNTTTGTARIDSVHVIAAESMNAAALQIQNLGRGQLQLRSGYKAEDLVARTRNTRLAARLPAMAADFHRRQMAKIEKEMSIWAARAEAEIEA